MTILQEHTKIPKEFQLNWQFLMNLLHELTFCDQYQSHQNYYTTCKSSCLLQIKLITFSLYMDSMKEKTKEKKSQMIIFVL